jgi:hypothetical protein
MLRFHWTIQFENCDDVCSLDRYTEVQRRQSFVWHAATVQWSFASLATQGKVWTQPEAAVEYHMDHSRQFWEAL